MLHNLKTKIISLVTIPLIVIVLAIGSIITIMSIDNNQKNLETFKISAYTQKKEFIKRRRTLLKIGS